MKNNTEQPSRLPKSTAGGTYGSSKLKRVPAVFFRTEAGNEPVRSWLKTMDAEDKRLIGQDIQTVEFGWPVGMPTCRPLGDGLHEVRTELRQNRIARVFFYVNRNQRRIPAAWHPQEDESDSGV
jgi:Phage derived protein Gp49-like (DUF891)